MKTERFEQIIKDDLLSLCSKVRIDKGSAYASSQDALSNFKRCSVLSGADIEKVWFVFFVKHFDALSSYLRGEYKDSEPIKMRLVDMINY